MIIINSQHKNPTIHFKLKKEIDITTISSQDFYIERKYHSGGMLMTDKIQCRIIGFPKTKPSINIRANKENI